MPQIIPWVTFATSAINLMNRGEAGRVLEEDVVTPEQTTGSVVQDFASRGITIDPNSPAVKEALRRRSLARRQAQAERTIAGPAPGLEDILAPWIQK